MSLHPSLPPYMYTSTLDPTHLAVRHPSCSRCQMPACRCFCRPTSGAGPSQSVIMMASITNSDLALALCLLPGIPDKAKRNKKIPSLALAQQRPHGPSPWRRVALRDAYRGNQRPPHQKRPTTHSAPMASRQKRTRSPLAETAKAPPLIATAPPLSHSRRASGPPRLSRLI